MEALNVQIINPKAKSLLFNLEEMNLIQIKAKPNLAEMLAKLRRNEVKAPLPNEIAEEVESVRKKALPQRRKGFTQRTQRIDYVKT
jgi:hypothetical protein